MNVVLIGCGGIGSHLVIPLAQFLAHHKKDETHVLHLIDGDSFAQRNGDRQFFDRVGPKALVYSALLARTIRGLNVESTHAYVSPSNVMFFVTEGDTVLLAVDNHATRKVVSDHAGTLANVCVISGGNELTDGDVLLYLRKNGKDCTPPLTYYPEIAAPEEKGPYDKSCEERAAGGAPQLVWTNNAVAAAMGNLFWRYVTNPSSCVHHVRGSGRFTRMTHYHRAHVDIFDNTITPVRPQHTKEVSNGCST